MTEDRVDQETTEPEMLVPVKPPVVMATIIVVVVALFVLGASVNLSGIFSVDACSWTASLLWMIFVTLMLAGSCYYKGGFERVRVSVLAHFSRQWFVRIEQGSNEQPLACFGFNLWGKRYYQFKVCLDGITKVDWSAGQATHLASRDVNDWSTWVWYDIDQVELADKPAGKDDQWLYQVMGSSGNRDVAEAMGQKLVEFLRDAGADLIEAHQGYGFVRAMETVCCSHCGYDLTGIQQAEGAVCPQCGQQID